MAIATTSPEKVEIRFHISKQSYDWLTSFTSPRGRGEVVDQALKFYRNNYTRLYQIEQKLDHIASFLGED